MRGPSIPLSAEARVGFVFPFSVEKEEQPESVLWLESLALGLRLRWLELVFKMEAASFQELHMDFLPRDLPYSITTIVLVIIACFAAGIGSWTYAVPWLQDSHSLFELPDGGTARIFEESAHF